MNDKFAVSNASDASEQAKQQVNEAVQARLDELDKGLQVELTKVDIKDGDVFVVKLTGDEFDEATVLQFKKALKGKFPKVEFIVLAVPAKHNVEFQKLAKGKTT